MAGSYPTPDILARRRLINNCTTRTISTSTATTTLGLGVYEVTTDLDCFILQGAVSVTATTTASVPLWARSYVEIYVSAVGVDDTIAAVSASGTGTLYCAKVE